MTEPIRGWPDKFDDGKLVFATFEDGSAIQDKLVVTDYEQSWDGEMPVFGFETDPRSFAEAIVWRFADEENWREGAMYGAEAWTAIKAKQDSR